MLIRQLRDDDSLEDLTDLLHRAYRQLAEMGMCFFASHQTVADTRARVSRGECFVAEIDGTIAGTITWYRDPAIRANIPLYNEPRVARFGQFAVEPALQRRGIGRRLLDHVESEARRAGYTTLALDTPERATHLISWYERLGFQHAGFAQWPDVNYRSVLMAKQM